MRELQTLLDDGIREDKPGQRTTPSRRQRITLLLGTYEAALGAASPEPQGRSGKPSSRHLQHTPLWYLGSYDDLDDQLVELSRRSPKVYRYVYQHYVLEKPLPPGNRHAAQRKAALGVEYLKRNMPRFITVPDDVLKRGGFKPEREKEAA